MAGLITPWNFPLATLAKKLPAALGVRGWITDSAATSLLAQAGLNLDALRRQAAFRSFRPVPTGIVLDMRFGNTVQGFRCLIQRRRGRQQSTMEIALT